MTLEELKLEADKLGYRIAPKSIYIKWKPCACGSHRRREWIKGGEHGGYFYECAECGLRTPIGKTKRQAKLNWNNAVSLINEALERQVNP